MNSKILLVLITSSLQLSLAVPPNGETIFKKANIGSDMLHYSSINEEGVSKIFYTNSIQDRFDYVPDKDFIYVTAVVRLYPSGKKASEEEEITTLAVTAFKDLIQNKIQKHAKLQTTNLDVGMCIKHNETHTHLLAYFANAVGNPWPDYPTAPLAIIPSTEAAAAVAGVIINELNSSVSALELLDATIGVGYYGILRVCKMKDMVGIYYKVIRSAVHDINSNVQAHLLYNEILTGGYEFGMATLPNMENRAGVTPEMDFLVSYVFLKV